MVNCSLFNPTPSLSAMIVNHFKMRPDIGSYNLSGMGCSAGLISISLAKELLQVGPPGRRMLHANGKPLHAAPSSHMPPQLPACSAPCYCACCVAALLSALCSHMYFMYNAQYCLMGGG